MVRINIKYEFVTSVLAVTDVGLGSFIFLTADANSLRLSLDGNIWIWIWI